MFRADDPASRLGFDCPIKVDRESVWFSPSSVLDNNSVGLREIEFQSMAEISSTFWLRWSKQCFSDAEIPVFCTQGGELRVSS